MKSSQSTRVWVQANTTREPDFCTTCEMLICGFSLHAVCIAAKKDWTTTFFQALSVCSAIMLFALQHDLKYIFQAFATCLFNFGFGLGLGNIFFVLVGEVNHEYFQSSRQCRYSDIFFCRNRNDNQTNSASIFQLVPAHRTSTVIPLVTFFLNFLQVTFY